jgi:hypothetical protein
MMLTGYEAVQPRLQTCGRPARLGYDVREERRGMERSVGREPSVCVERYRGLILGMLMLLVIIAMCLTAVPAGAQESTVDENAVTSEDATEDSAVLPEVKTPVEAEAQAKDKAQDETVPVGEAGSLNASEQQLLRDAAQNSASGDLAGKPVNEEDNDNNMITDRLTIDANDCRVDKGATIVVEDETGTIGALVDGVNATIDSTSDQVVVEGPDPSNENENIPFIAREDLIGELTVLSSAGIDCGADDGGGNGGGGNGGGGNGGGGDGGEPQPLPPDEVKGPLAGGTARGDDVLVKGDLGCGPNGENPCIDQIVIQTENCKLTAQGDDLTITLSDQGEPFRLIDGENVDITIRQDGTIVANGRKTLGPLATAFNGGKKDNPTRRILPIPVKQGDTPGGSINDTFPIISSTGIDGEGCRVVETSDTNQPGGSGEQGQVIGDTISDEPLPNTGGPPLSGLAVIALGLAVVGGATVVRTGVRRRDR